MRNSQTFYLYSVVFSIVDVPIITQSDPGTENNGVANAHTCICYFLDPSLANTLQHHFVKGHNNILSEIKWSLFHCDFFPGFEDILEVSVHNGWYDTNDPLERYVCTYYLCVYDLFSILSVLFFAGWLFSGSSLK